MPVYFQLKVRFQVIFALFIFSHYTAKGQTEYIDSLFNALQQSEKDTNRVFLMNELSWEFSQIDFEKSIQFAENAISLSKELEYEKGIIVGESYLSGVYTEMGDLDEAIIHIEEALRLDTKNNDVVGIAMDHNQLGIIYENIGDFKKATYHYYEAKAIFEKFEATYNVCIIQLNLAQLAIRDNEGKKAIELIDEIAEILPYFEEPHLVCKMYNILGHAHLALRNFRNSEKNYEKALKLLSEYENKVYESETYNGLGNLFWQEDKYEKAIDAYQKSLEIDEALEHTIGMATAYGNMSIVYAQMGEKEKSEEYIKRSVELGKEGDNLNSLMTQMKFASQINYRNNNFKMAYNLFDFAERIEDTLYTERKNEQIIEIEKKYEIAKKEKEISELKNERDVAKAKSLLVDTIIFFSTGLILLLVVIVFFYFKHQKTKANQRKIELEQKVLRSQMNPHFIFNSLNSIQRIFIEGDEVLANDYMGDFGKLLRTILENSAEPKISLKTEIETLKLYIRLEMIRMDDRISCTYDIDENLDLLNNFVPPLIIQPFVENAIWHGILPKEGNEKGEIHISIKKQSDTHLICTISDNGIGIEESLKEKTDKGHLSKGLSISKERIGLSGDVSVKQQKSGGTKATLIIPLHL